MIWKRLRSTIKVILDVKNLNERQTKRLNEISYEIRKPFVDLIDSFYPANNNDLNWSFSGLASKDLYITDIYLQLCIVLLVKEEIYRDNEVKKIIVYNNGTAATINEFLSNAGKKIEVQSKDSYLERLRVKFKRLGYCFLLTIINILYKKNNAANYSSVTFLDAFVLDNSFVNGKYIDRWYTGIRDFLSAEAQSSIYVLPTVSTNNPLKQIVQMKSARHDGRFVLKEDYLTIKDNISAFLKVLFPGSANFPGSTLLGINVDPLLKYEYKTSKTNISSFRAWTNYYFVKRFTQKGNTIKLLVDWNENQLIDKALLKGVHDFSPHTRTIAYRGYIISEQFIHIVPTPAEKTADLLSDEYAVIGDELQTAVCEFIPDLPVKTAPAFRFNVQSVKGKPKQTGLYILLALPIDLALSKSLIEDVIEIKDKLPANTIYTIKSHPSNSEDTIKSLFTSWNTDLLFTQKDFGPALREANILVTAMSTAAMEAIANGMPTVIKCKLSELYIMPIPRTIPEVLWKTCLNAIELLNAIIELHKLDDNVILMESDQIRTNYFAPANLDTVGRFLVPGN